VIHAHIHHVLVVNGVERFTISLNQGERPLAKLVALVAPNIEVTAVELVEHDVLGAYSVPYDLVNKLCA
jgi:hypothetical protein